METNNASQIIDELGGTGAVAELCGVEDPVVSQWRRHGIPKGWRRYLQAIRPAAFGLTRRDVIKRTGRWKGA